MTGRVPSQYQGYPPGRHSAGALPVARAPRQSPIPSVSARGVNLVVQGIKDNILRKLFRQLFHGFAPGGLEAGQEIWAVVMAAAFTFPANFANSQGRASIAATGVATCSIQKNGVQVGTMVFSASATATFASSGGAAQSFAAGDVLSLIAPNPADATLEGMKWVLAAQVPE